MTSVIMAVVYAVLVTKVRSRAWFSLRNLRNNRSSARTARGLGLDGFALIRVQPEPDGARVVHVVTADETAAACPTCGVISTARKGSATTHPRDVPYGPDPVRLVWHKSRWRCRETLCERGSFTESLPQVPTRCRLTTGLYEQVGAGAADGYSCVLAVADAHGVSWPVAHAAFIARVTPALEAELPAVAVLGIDETRRGKPIWAQAPGCLRTSTGAPPAR